MNMWETPPGEDDPIQQGYFLKEAAMGEMGFFEKLTQAIYLDYVLKVLGIVLFALAVLKGWDSLGWFTKFLLVSGPIAWFVGARFTKIYR